MRYGIILILTMLFPDSKTDPSEAIATSVALETRSGEYKLSAVTLDETPPKNHPLGGLPLKLVGRGSTGRIVDSNRNIVMSAEKKGPIYGLSLTPDRKRALLYFGDATYTVASVEGLKNIASPPIRPEEPADATGFSWFILDNDHLIGYSTLPSLESTEGMTASEADGLPPRDTLVYVYTIASGEMNTVKMDETVPRPFGLSLDSYGRVVIAPSSGLEYLGISLTRTSRP